MEIVKMCLIFFPRALNLWFVQNIRYRPGVKHEKRRTPLYESTFDRVRKLMRIRLFFFFFFQYYYSRTMSKRDILKNVHGTTCFNRISPIKLYYRIRI